MGQKRKICYISEVNFVSLQWLFASEWIFELCTLLGCFYSCTIIFEMRRGRNSCDVNIWIPRVAKERFVVSLKWISFSSNDWCIQNEFLNILHFWSALSFLHYYLLKCVAEEPLSISINLNPAGCKRQICRISERNVVFVQWIHELCTLLRLEFILAPCSSEVLFGKTICDIKI